jgi:hypothetical protein
MKSVATNATVVIVKNSGEWILVEQPKQTIEENAKRCISLKW